MGRDWLGQFDVSLGKGKVNKLQASKQLQEVLDKHSVVFDNDLGCMQGMTVNLPVDNNVNPKFFKPRSVPYVLKPKVEAELTRLENLGIISPVKFSKWAAPIVPVLKKDGSLRICGDYKITINQASQVQTYPLPRVEELFSDLSGGKYFSKLDMSNAYLQLPLDKSLKEFVTINIYSDIIDYHSECPLLQPFFRGP